MVNQVTHRLPQVVFGFILMFPVPVAAEFTNRQVTVVVSPMFEQRGEWTCLIVSNATHYFRFWTLPERERWTSFRLDTNSVYTFVVDDGRYTRELLKIKLQGNTLFDREVCDVHRVKLGNQEVRYVYGYVRPAPPAPGEPSWETERELFPFRQRKTIWGGCIPHEAKTTMVLFCSQCETAYQEWKRQARPAK